MKRRARVNSDAGRRDLERRLAAEPGDLGLLERAFFEAMRRGDLAAAQDLINRAGSLPFSPARFEAWGRMAAALDAASPFFMPVYSAEFYVSPRERELTPRQEHVRRVAYALKDPTLAGYQAAAREAAIDMLPLVPPGATFVPIPSSGGDRSANLGLAQELADLSGGRVDMGILFRGTPVEASHARRRRGSRGLSAHEHAASFVVPSVPNVKLVLVDNVTTTGATMQGAWMAMGSPPHAIGVAYAKANEVTTIQPRMLPNPPWLGKVLGWTAIGAVSDLLTSPFQKLVSGGVERVFSNPGGTDADLRALERRAQATGALDDALALWAAEVRAGVFYSVGGSASGMALTHVRAAGDELEALVAPVMHLKASSPSVHDKQASIYVRGFGSRDREVDGLISLHFDGSWHASWQGFAAPTRRRRRDGSWGPWVSRVVTDRYVDGTREHVLNSMASEITSWLGRQRTNPIRARFGADREPVDVYGPAFPGSTTYWDARFVHGGEQGYLGAFDLYDAQGRRWQDTRARPARPAWTNPPVRENCPACLVGVAALWAAGRRAQ